MWESQRRVWLLFTTWIGCALVCAYVDYHQRRTIALPIFLVLSFIVSYIVFRGARPSRFKFELLTQGAKGVRSSLGFEIYFKPNEIEYIEGDRKLSIRNRDKDQLLQVFRMPLSKINWEPPFQDESISEQKRREIGKAIAAAAGFIQGAEMGRR